MNVQRIVGKGTRRINIPHQTIFVAKRPKTKINSMNNENQGSLFVDLSFIWK